MFPMFPPRKQILENFISSPDSDEQLTCECARQGVRARQSPGRVGDAKLVIVATGEVSRGEPVWCVFLGEAPHSDESVRGVDQVRVVETLND